MKHKTLTTWICISLTASLLALTGCSHTSATSSSATTEAVVGIQEIFDQVSSKLTYHDTMELISDDYSDTLLSISPELYTDCILYMGSGATAEELLLFQGASVQAAQQIKNSLLTHIEDQKAAFEGYDPEELKILSSALVLSRDSLVILCVSQDNAAAKTILSAYAD